MDLIKPNYFSMLTRCFAVADKNFLTVTVFCGFLLDNPDTFLEEDAVWEIAGEVLPRTQVFDHGWPKPSGEYLVAGPCFAAGGQNVLAAKVSIRLGSLSKDLYVFGNRKWVSPMYGINTISKPEPFQAMDLSWERAFGGPDYEENPLGVGLGGTKGPDGSRIHYLPNFEDPAHLIAATSDHPKPAGLSPMGLDWPARLKNLGSFDDQWLRKHWPGFPKDYDFSYFNLAPIDQRLDGFFRGDEPFEIKGMHPEQTRIAGRLPGLRARVFAVKQLQAHEAAVTEIKTSLDTVWFIPSRQLGVLIWRGVMPAADDEAGEVMGLGAFAEKLDQEPLPAATYRDRLLLGEQESVPEEISVQVPAEPEVEPPPAPPPPEPVPTDNRLAEFMGPILAASAALEEKINLHLRQLGIDPEQMPDEPPTPGWSEVPETNVEGIGPGDPEAFLQNMAAKSRDLENKLSESLKNLGVDPKTVPSEPPEPDTSPEAINKLLSMIPDRQGKLKEAILALQNEFQKNESEIAEMLAQVQKPGPEITEPAPGEISMDMPEPESTLTREEVFDRYQRGESLANLDLSGLDLSGGDFSAADFSNSILENTSLKGSVLSGARLHKVVLTGTDLTSADLSDACLSEASVIRSKMVEANLSGADFTGADLSEADLTGAVMPKAIFNHADLSEAKLCKADGREVSAHRTLLHGADLAETNFSAADMTLAQFDESSLNKTNFSSSILRNTSWADAKGEAVVFEKADLESAKTYGHTTFPQTDFSEANLTKAYWEDTDFEGADFSRAKMPDATMTRCNLQRAVLRSADARQTDFSGSNLSETDARLINLFNGSLRKADLNNTGFEGANLSGVDFYKSNLVQTKLNSARLNRTLFRVWRQK